MYIVTREGRAYELQSSVDEVTDGKYQFEVLNIDCQLEWTYDVSDSYRLTTDGRIYSLNTSQLIDTGQDRFKQIVELHDGMMYALTVEGQLITYMLNDDRITSRELGRDHVSYLTNNGLIIHRDIEERIREQVGESILEVRDRAIITDGHITTVMGIDHNRYAKRRGQLIGVSSVISHHNGSILLLTIEEYNGSIITRTYNSDMTESSQYIGQILDHMHQQCPWIGMFNYCGYPHLVNNDHYSIKVLNECGLASSNIPDCISSALVTTNSTSDSKLN